MTISRRLLLKTSVGVALSGAATSMWSPTAWANTGVAIGEKKIDVLSDGHLVFPADFLFAGIEENDLAPILKKYDLSAETLRPDCNLTLVRDGERTILFDVGAGPNFMPSAGMLTSALEAIEVDPADVTHVVFTHAHPDHLWGVLDEFDEPLFPEAQHMVAKAEWDYWTDPKTVETIGEARQAFAAGASRLLKAVEEKLSFFSFGEEILPGIMARNSVGHTPGHTAFEVRGRNEGLMIVGDAIGNHHVAFEQPGWPAGSDQDREKGIKARLSLLDQIASEKMMIIGFHLPHPGIGRAEKAGTGYRFVAA